MKADSFAYWLQGYFEVDGNSRRGLTAKQVKIIRSHLNMVFKHDLDPKVDGDDPKKKKDLQDIHDGLAGIGGGGSGFGPMIRC